MKLLALQLAGIAHPHYIACSNDTNEDSEIFVSKVF